jgi:molecular chaperone GrpE
VTPTQPGGPDERPARTSDEVAGRAAQGGQGDGASAAGSGSDAEQPAVGEIHDPADSSKVDQDIDALVAAEQARDEYLELAQRTKADFENYRKRMAAEVQAASVRGKVELALGLIGVIDNLERALAAVGIEPGEEQTPTEPLAEGFFLTYRELCAVLGRAEVESFDPTGERFDPTWHEALQKLPVEGTEPGTVVETLQKGYRLGEQLIRPARVVVSE